MNENYFTCNAGEHLVMLKLAMNKVMAAMPRTGSELVDIIVVNPKGKGGIGIQVKTSKNAFKEVKKPKLSKYHKESYWEWRVKSKVFDIEDKNYVYVFVDLGIGQKNEPICFVAPGIEVLDFVKKNGPWVEEMESFWIHESEKDKYLERWDYIKKLIKSY